MEWDGEITDDHVPEKYHESIEDKAIRLGMSTTAAAVSAAIVGFVLSVLFGVANDPKSEWIPLFFGGSFVLSLCFFYFVIFKSGE